MLMDMLSMLMDMLSMFDGSSVHVDGYVAGRGAIVGLEQNC